jgi:O-antigen/teichoic acid export membrane protein
VNSKTSKLVLIKNAFANVVRGSSSALIALLVPPFLINSLSTEEFSAWILILQLSTYSNYLDFGIQTAVGRFVAYTNELDDREGRDRIINTAFIFLTSSAAFAICIILLGAWQLNNIFPQLPNDLKSDTQISLLFVGISTALGLPTSVFIGTFIGFQRYDIPAIIIGGAKLTTGLLIILAAKQYSNIVPMAVVFATINLMTYFFEYISYLKLNTGTIFSFQLFSRRAGKELFNYCYSLSIWSFAMLLVTGIDTTLVAWLDFKNVVYYGIAANLIVFISGLQNAIFNVLIPSAAVLTAQEKTKELGKLLISTTRYGMLILVLTGLFFIAFGDDFISLWLGPEYVEKLMPIIKILVLANIVRLSAVPYATILVGTGQQRLVVLSPLLEGGMNLVFSIILGNYFGARGIALGTLIGAFFGVGGNIFYNMKITMRVIKFKLSEYLTDGLIKPSLCSTPLFLMMVARHHNNAFEGILKLFFELITILITFFTVWILGLTLEDRKKIINMTKSLRQKI